MSNIDKALTGAIENPFPMPLKVIEHDSGRHEVLDANGVTIDQSGDGGFDKEKAEYLAHCVNSHQPLLKALHDIKKALESNPNCDAKYLFECCSNATEIAHNAIFSAESKK